jgi:hypothetical protein
MLVIEDAVKLFGLSPKDKSVDAYLNILGIEERPEFDENPEEWLSKLEQGYILMFRAKHGYTRLYGATNATGDMIFNGIRLHGPLNTNGFQPYLGKLPFGIHFEQSPDEIKKTLGTPDFEDEAGTSKRTLLWYSFKELQIGIVFTADEKDCVYITLKPVQYKYITR